MKKFIGEFKTFVSRGNIMDLAIAVILGGAFGKIVSSFANDIIMPLISLLLGKIHISELKWQITETLSLNYGNFLQAAIDFLIMALFIFIAIKILKRTQLRAEKLKQILEAKLKAEAKKEEKEAEAKAEEVKRPSAEELLLIEIRDLLKSQKGE